MKSFYIEHPRQLTICTIDRLPRYHAICIWTGHYFPNKIIFHSSFSCNDSTASIMNSYPPHRHKFPDSASCISSRVGLSFRSSNALADNSMPGVQNPHCTAPCSTNAFCNRDNSPFCARPSTVRMRRPSAFLAGIIHEFVGSPSTRMVHAPQSPSPQPSFVPVSPKRLRKTNNMVSCDSISTDTGLSFKTNCSSSISSTP